MAGTHRQVHLDTRPRNGTCNGALQMESREWWLSMCAGELLTVIFPFENRSTGYSDASKPIDDLLGKQRAPSDHCAATRHRCRSC